MNQLSLFDDSEPEAESAPTQHHAVAITATEQPTPATQPATRRRGAMRTIRRDGKWWIVNIPVPDVTENGPYDRRSDADDDLDGLRKFFDRNPEYADHIAAA